jgi:hypothetical protein
MTYDDINRLYQQYLGRDASQDEAQNWISGAYGARDPAGVEAQIASSGEAQAYRGGADGGGPGGGGGGAGGAGGFDGGPSSPFGPWTGSFSAPTPAPLPTAPTWITPGTIAAPTFTAPGYTPPPGFSFGEQAPTYTPPPAFSYGDFQAPSYAEAANDPGYQFRLQQGTQALQNAASARGTLNDSGTLKALIDYGQGAASQEYQNVYGRDLSTYGTNRANAADTYATNYKTQYQDPYAAAVTRYQTGFGNALSAYNTNYATQYADPYAHAYQAAQDAFAPQMAGYAAQLQGLAGQNQAAQQAWLTNAQNTQHQNDLTNTNTWNDYLLAYQDFENRRNLGATFALQS